MNYVWVVKYGNYQEYTVETVASSPEAAEAWVRSRWNGNEFDGPQKRMNTSDYEMMHEDPDHYYYMFSCHEIWRLPKEEK